MNGCTSQRANGFLKRVNAGVGVLMCLLAGLAVSISHANEKIEGVLLVPDVLASPGKPARLEARLVRSGLMGPIGLGGENVVFTIGKKVMGTALTGGDGRAYLEFTNSMRGNLLIEVALEGSPRVVAEKARAVFAAWERRRPILLVDLETLFPEEPSLSLPIPTVPLQFGLTRPSLPDPIPEASKELHKLTSFYYNVMYLDRRGHTPVQAIQQWLFTHEFPMGVTRAIQPDRDSLKGFLDQLREKGWDNVEAGIGKDADFAHVLVKNRIRTVIFSQDEEPQGFPRRTKFTTSWSKIRKHL